MKPIHFSRTRRAAFSLIELLFVITILGLLAALLFPVFAKAREAARTIGCLSNLKQMGTALSLYVQDYDETYPMNRLPDETHPMKGCLLKNPSPYPQSSLEESRLNWKRVLQPYVKNRAMLICPTNPYADHSDLPSVPPGDYTNRFYPQREWLPLSYAYNGNFFNEGIPPCLYGEKLERPRRLPEIDVPANLILLLESRIYYPDLGSWAIPWFAGANNTQGVFQSHAGGLNWLFCDGHAKKLKFASTCKANMWTDVYDDSVLSCADLQSLPAEYE